MAQLETNIFTRMNELGEAGKPFVFLLDFEMHSPLLFEWEESKKQLLWQTPQYSNFLHQHIHTEKIEWQVMPVSYGRYQEAYNLVQKHIHNGDSYLLNLTMPSRIKTNLSLDNLFFASQAPYKIYLKNRFVCFSPEIFVRIDKGRISSYPMKGTIDATLPDAELRLTTDKKELAEHNTIVDLIRNDLSTVAENVEVRRFCYIDRIKSNKTDLLQMSSEVTGELGLNYTDRLGDIFQKLLPAGSVSGAPKKKTTEIILNAEKYKRGFYTGVFGVFDGINVDSCVLIRYIENENGNLTFKSGGGITHLSNCEDEYLELITKVYVPIA